MGREREAGSDIPQLRSGESLEIGHLYYSREIGWCCDTAVTSRDGKRTMLVFKFLSPERAVRIDDNGRVAAHLFLAAVRNVEQTYGEQLQSEFPRRARRF